MLPVEAPFKPYTDLDGKPLDSGYVYLGQAGQNPVTTPVPVFWDAAGTIPAAQPLRTVGGYIARGGTPANVFIAGAYSQLVQDSKQRQVAYAASSSDISTSGRIEAFSDQIKAFSDSLSKAGPVPQQFGAKGDGVTDDTDAFAAWSAAVSVAGLGFVPRATYNLPSGFDAPSNATVICAPGAIFSIASGADSAVGIRAFGSVGPTYNLSASPAIYGDTLTLSSVNASNFSDGDYIEVLSDDVADVSNRTGTRLGEMARINTVVAGTITLYGTLRMPVLFATNPRIRKITFFDNLAWYGGAISGRNSGADPAQIGVYGKYARNVNTFNLSCNSTMAAGHLWESSYNCWANNSRTFNNRRPTGGYSVGVAYTSQWCGAKGGEFFRSRQAFSTVGGSSGYGVPMDCGIFNARSRFATGDDFGTQSVGMNIQILDCVSEFAAGNAVNIECQSATVRVQAIKPGGHGVSISNYAGYLGNYDVRADIVSAGGRGLNFDAGVIPANQSGLERLTAFVTGNCNQEAIWINWDGGIPLATSINVSGSLVSGSVTNGLFATYCRDIDLTGLRIRCTRTGANAFRLTNVYGGDLRGARGDLPTGATGYSFSIGTSCSHIDLSDTRGRSQTPVSSGGIYLDTDATLCIVGDLGPDRFIGHTTQVTIAGANSGHTGTLLGSAAYDPPSLAAGATQQTTVTVAQAAVGDIAEAAFSIGSAGIRWSADVTSANTVTVTQQNVSGGAIDLGTGTLKVIVRKIG